jgi:hypothetical protein
MKVKEQLGSVKTDLQSSSKHHNATADLDRPPSTQSICDVASEGKGRDEAAGVNRANEA